MGPPPLSELQNHHHHPTLSLFRRKPKMEKSSPPSSSTSTVCNSPGKALSLSPKPRLMRRTRRARNPDEAQSGQGKRSSIYRGVTKHRWTGRYEAHLWDKSCWNPIQNKKGRQVYLGAYEDEEAAAHTYDLAALKYWGPDTILNFPVSTYMKEFQEMQGISREEYLASLRRRSSGFSRGASKYRGVAKHHHNGRWEARIGRVYGNKYLYLGTFNTQEEAAQAYDRAALEYRGPNAVTNFDISRYIKHQRQPQQQQLFAQPLPQPQLFPQPQPQQPIEQFQPQPMEAVVDGPIDQMAAVEPPQEAPIDPGPITGFDNYSSISEPMGDMSWSICMDSGFDNYSNIAMDGPTDLRYFFGGDSFVDDIDCLFEGSGLFGSDADAADGGDGGGGQKVGGILDDSGKIGSGFVGETGQAAEAQGGLTTTAASSQVKSASYPFPISICS